MNAVLGPPDRLTEVVGSGGKAVVSTRKIGKTSHLIQALFPNESEIDITDVVRRTVESRATPSLPERLRIGGLRNTHDDALGIFHVPRDAAVRSAKRAQVGEHTASPQRSVPVSIRESRIACRPALVIHAVPPATGATKIGKGRYLVLRFRLHCFRLLRMHQWRCRPITDGD